MSHRHDYERKLGPALPIETRSISEREQALRARYRETVRIAQEAPWMLGPGARQREVAWARKWHTESVARERADAAARSPTGP